MSYIQKEFGSLVQGHALADNNITCAHLDVCQFYPFLDYIHLCVARIPESDPYYNLNVSIFHVLQILMFEGKNLQILRFDMFKF
jgi:hypothetical protein